MEEGRVYREKEINIRSFSFFFRFPTRRCKVFIFFLSLNLVSLADSSLAFWVSAGVTSYNLLVAHMSYKL